MIYGIGVDMVEVRRMEAGVARFGERLARRILSGEELADYRGSNRPAQLLARRFAAKEALLKALGTGFRKGGVPLSQISVGHDELGKPVLLFADEARHRLGQLGISGSHLSITDEREYALAYVILEK